MFRLKRLECERNPVRSLEWVLVFPEAEHRPTRLGESGVGVAVALHGLG